MNRRGAALIVALLALLIAGAVASAALATGQLRWRAGLAQRAAARATLEVQSALDRTFVAWDNRRFDSLPVGAVWEVGRVEGGGSRQRDSVARLGPWLFQVRSVAEIGAPDAPPLARDAAALLITLAPLALADSAAVVAPALSIRDGARVDGSDRVPAGWEGRCPTAGSPVSAQLADTSPFDRFSHDPRLLLAPTSGPDSVTVLQTDGRVVDGMGSGILWARGSLELSGDFYFAGVILVEGSLRLSDRVRVEGTILAGGPVLIAGMAEINHSRCAIRSVLQSNRVVPRRLPGGWWRLD
jgi:hypothetical protein